MSYLWDGTFRNPESHIISVEDSDTNIWIKESNQNKKTSVFIYLMTTSKLKLSLFVLVLQPEWESTIFRYLIKRVSVYTSHRPYGDDESVQNM